MFGSRLLALLVSAALAEPASAATVRFIDDPGSAVGPQAQGISGDDGTGLARDRAVASPSQSLSSSSTATASVEFASRLKPATSRAAILLIGGDKTCDKRFYQKMIPIADQLYDEHLEEIAE